MGNMLRVAMALAAIVFMEQAAAGQTVSLSARNNMRDAIYVYVKSHERSDWTFSLVGRGRRTALPLVGPDDFEVAFRDLQGTWFRGDPLPLRQLIGSNPQYELTFGGVFATEMLERTYWDCRRRRWYRRQFEVQRRVAVTLNFRFPDGTRRDFLVPEVRNP